MLTISASVEHSFSKLTFIKTFLRSIISQERLNWLIMLSIKKEITEQHNYTYRIIFFSFKTIKHIVFYWWSFGHVWSYYLLITEIFYYCVFFNFLYCLYYIDLIFKKFYETKIIRTYIMIYNAYLKLDLYTRIVKIGHPFCSPYMQTIEFPGCGYPTWPFCTKSNLKTWL